MTLKTKLLASFLIMLLLIGAIVVLGWWSMERMSNQADVSNGVENTLTKVLEAQERQLSYLLLRDKAIVGELINDLKEAAVALEGARVRMITPENIRMGREIADFLQWYQSAFLKLVETDTEAGRNEKAMVAGTQTIIQGFEELSGNIEEAIRKGNASKAAMDALRAVSDAHMAFANARLAARVFVGVPSADNAKSAEAQQEIAARRLELAENSLSIPANIVRAQELSKFIKEYRANYERMRDATMLADQQIGEIRSRLTTVSRTTAALSAGAMNMVVSTKDSGNNISLGAAIFALLASVGIALTISGNVQRQLGKDPSELATIAQRVTDGDYEVDDGSQRIGVYGNLVAMVDALKQHINSARQESERAHGESDRAREAMRNAEEASHQAQLKTNAILEAADRLESVANIVSSASSQLAAQIEQSEKGASEQAVRVTETVTAMEEMNATVVEVAQNAASAAEVSTATRQKAESGARVVQQAVKSIQQVQAQSLQLKEDMSHLDENARAINQIMGVISDIADQTNLLALNAAIEAARAGEAGRGFAVVADEVRKLAEKTMASTTDVGNAIRAIQQSATQSMAQVEQSVTYIEQATTFANQSGASLAEIVSMVDNTADQVRAIATASEEQASSSDEINRSIVHVNTIASETARAMQEAASAVSELASQAQVLSRLIEDMKKG